MKDALKTDKLSIVACDKGPGLLLMGNNTLQSTYQEYLKGNSFITSNLDIKKALFGLKNSLLEVDSRASIINTDDRVPTFYFKIKTHKDTFTTNTTRFSEIFSYNLGPKTLAKIARPVVNHKTSITCLSSQYLRKFITPIIEQSPYLTQDIFHTMDRLCRLGHPDYIYTGDIDLLPLHPPLFSSTSLQTLPTLETKLTSHTNFIIRRKHFILLFHIPAKPLVHSPSQTSNLNGKPPIHNFSLSPIKTYIPTTLATDRLTIRKPHTLTSVHIPNNPNNQNSTMINN